MGKCIREVFVVNSEGAGALVAPFVACNTSCEAVWIEAHWLWVIIRVRVDKHGWESNSRTGFEIKIVVEPVTFTEDRSLASHYTIRGWQFALDGDVCQQEGRIERCLHMLGGYRRNISLK